MEHKRIIKATKVVKDVQAFSELESFIQQQGGQVTQVKSHIHGLIVSFEI